MVRSGSATRQPGYESNTYPLVVSREETGKGSRQITSLFVDLCHSLRYQRLRSIQSINANDVSPDCCGCCYFLALCTIWCNPFNVDLWVL